MIRTLAAACVAGIALAASTITASAHTNVITLTPACAGGQETITATITNTKSEFTETVTQTGGGYSTGQSGGALTYAPPSLVLTTGASGNMVAIIPTDGPGTATIAIHGKWTDGFTQDSKASVEFPGGCRIVPTPTPTASPVPTSTPTVVTRTTTSTTTVFVPVISVPATGGDITPLVPIGAVLVVAGLGFLGWRRLR